MYEELMTTKEAAKILGVTPSRVRQLLRQDLRRREALRGVHPLHRRASRAAAEVPGPELHSY